LIDQDQWSTYRPLFENKDLHPEPPPSSSPLFIKTTAQVLKHCTDTVTNQGIVAICDIPQYTLFQSSSSSTQQNQNQLEQDTSLSSSSMHSAAPALYLILDAVSDPGNMGTILRSSVATGVAGVICLADCVDPWNPKAVRSSMGATFHIPVLQIPTWKECQTLLCNQHNISRRNIWAATMLEPESQMNTTTADTLAAGTCHFHVDWISEPSALIIGNEGNGLTDAVREAVQRQEIRTVYVPMEPGTMESLNAAVCGSVILFEYYRQKQMRQIQQTTV
jgi:TrmH family RNA methyltransferase